MIDTAPDPGVADDAAHGAAAELLRALANPHRVAIVLELGHGERCVHELVEALGVPQPLVSQHLRVLRDERLVSGRRRGREVAYVLTDQHVAHIVGDAVAHATEKEQP
jgi:DNA-binding transcriptional ArsR family regulator